MTINDLIEELQSFVDDGYGHWAVHAYALGGRPMSLAMGAVYVNEKDEEMQRIMLGPEVDW
jgi:hypothetical protein